MLLPAAPAPALSLRRIVSAHLDRSIIIIVVVVAAARQVFANGTESTRLSDSYRLSAICARDCGVYMAALARVRDNLRHEGSDDSDLSICQPVTS